MAPVPKQSMHCPNCGAAVSDDAVRCVFCESVLTLSACPACFTAVFQGTRFCPSCGAAVDRSEAESDKKRPLPSLHGSTPVRRHRRHPDPGVRHLRWDLAGRGVLPEDLRRPRTAGEGPGPRFSGSALRDSLVHGRAAREVLRPLSGMRRDHEPTQFRRMFRYRRRLLQAPRHLVRPQGTAGDRPIHRGRRSAKGP